MATKPSRAPVDRSMPAVMMTIVTPTATIPITPHSRSRVRMLAGVKNESVVNPKMATSTASSASETSRRTVSCLKASPYIGRPPGPTRGVLLGRRAAPAQEEYVSRLPADVLADGTDGFLGGHDRRHLDDGGVVQGGKVDARADGPHGQPRGGGTLVVAVGVDRAGHLALFDVLQRLALAVSSPDHHVLQATRSLSCLRRTLCHRVVVGEHGIDLRVLGQEVVHDHVRLL